ncbi:MAG TPA: hypothetical protein VGI74_04725 [Streptosporangiaceae bacterium]
MAALLLAGFAGALLVLFTADHVVKALTRARRRRAMRARLAAATVRAEEQQVHRRASVRASKALTSVIPAIQRPPLTIPGLPPRAAARPRNRNESTGPQATHPGRKPARTGEHHAHPADRAKRN